MLHPPSVSGWVKPWHATKYTFRHKIRHDIIGHELMLHSNTGQEIRVSRPGMKLSDNFPKTNSPTRVGTHRHRRPGQLLQT